MPCADNSAQTTITDLTGNQNGTLFNFGLTDGECNSNWVSDNRSLFSGCTDITINLPDENPYTLTQADIDAIAAGTTDNCGAFTTAITAGTTTYDCSNVGQSFTVTITATDDSGNTASCDATVTIADGDMVCNQPPTAVCMDITLDANQDCRAMLTTPQDIDGGSSDPDMDSLIFMVDNAGPYMIGVHPVQLIVSDGTLSDTCTAMVTVADNTAPVFDNPPMDETAECGNVPPMAPLTYTDNCDGAGSTGTGTDAMSGGMETTSGNTVTRNWTYTDAAGNTATWTQIITLEDTTPPMAVCQDVTVQLDPDGTATILPEAIDNGSSDACGPVTLSLDNDSFNCTDIATTEPANYALDFDGQNDFVQGTSTNSMKRFPLTLEAWVKPELRTETTTFYPNNVLSNDNAGQYGHGFGANINNSINQITVQYENGFRQINSAGLIAGEWQHIAVVYDSLSNTEALITTYLDGNEIDVHTYFKAPLNATGFLWIGKHNNDTGYGTRRFFKGQVDEVRVWERSLTQTEIQDNRFTTTVGDATDLVLYYSFENGPGSTLVSDILGNFNANLDVSMDPATDWVTPGAPIQTGFLAGQQVTLTVTDAANNSSTCMANITVIDETPPTAVCQDITISLDQFSSASITAADVDGGSAASCGIALMSVSPSSFSCADLGPQTVTLYVTDSLGNMAQCQATITVEDNTPPTVVCKPGFTIAPGEVIEEADVLASAADNCNTVNVSFAPASFTCAELGLQTVTVTATDSSGNQSSCTLTVTVEDNVDPVLDTPPSNMIVDCDYTIPTTMLGWTDNCDGTGMVPAVDSTVIVGCAQTLTRVWTYTDTAGNTASASQTITILDQTAPVWTTALPQESIQVECMDDVPAMVALDWTDNCGTNGTVAGDEYVNASGCPKTIDRVWYIEDACGNNTLFYQNITVFDRTAPEFVNAPEPITIECIDDLPPVTLLDWTDNCDGTGTVSSTDFIDGSGCALTVFRTWIYIDSCGNGGSVTQTIVVNDETPPAIVAPDNLTLSCADNIPAMSDIAFTDNCGGTGVAIGSETTSGTPCNQTITRGWTATDSCGNAMYVQQLITLEDNVAPELVSGPADITVCPGTTPALEAPVWADDCSSLSDAQPDFDVIPYGNSNWRYIQMPQNNNCQLNGEELPGFDDSSWDIGGGGFANVIPLQPCSAETFDLPSATYWGVNSNLIIRQRVNLPAGTSNLKLRIAFDNGFRAYVNGTAINNCTVVAGCAFLDKSILNVPDNVLVSGENVIVITAVDQGLASYLDVAVTADLPASGGTEMTETPLPNGLTRTWTQTDACGNANSYTQTITYGDTTPPSITCPADILVPADSGECGAFVTFDPPVATDNCDSIVTLRQLTGAPSGDFFLSGTTVVVFEAMDASGNIDTCSFNVTVEGHSAMQEGMVLISGWESNHGEGIVALDPIPPYSYESHGLAYFYDFSMIPAADDTNWGMDFINADGSITMVLGSILNNCLRDVNFTYFQTFVNIPTGTTLNTFNVSFDQVDDGARAYIFNSAYPNGVYNPAGDIVLGGNPVTADLSAYVVVGEVNRVVIVQVDDCASHNNLVNARIEVNGVTAVADCSFTVSTVIDQDVLCFGDTTGSATVTPAGGVEPYSYLWDNGETTATATALTSGMHTVDVTDSGGFTISDTITIADAPFFDAASTGSQVECGTNGTGTAFVDVVGGTPPYSFSWSNGSTSQTLTNAAPGMYTVIVTDSNGCELTKTAEVVIIDTTPPVLEATPNITVQCTSELPLVLIGYTDACDGVGFVSGVQTSDGQSCPETITRMYSKTDAAGNNTILTQTITVFDSTDPVFEATPDDITISCTDELPVPLALNWTDNCDGSGSVLPTDLSNEGQCTEEIFRTWDYEDDCGNLASVAQKITIIDTIPTILNVPADMTVACEGDAMSMNTITWTDACEGTGSIVAGTTTALGDACMQTITQTWLHIDNCGRYISGTQVITVNDSIPPVAVAPDDITVTCGMAPAMENLSWTDNCGDTGFVTGVDASDNGSPIEIITRTWTFSDNCGNQDAVSQTITVDCGNTCPENLVLNETYNTETIVYEVWNNITSTDNVAGTANIEYSAAVDIDLLPGFEVELGAEFHGYIEGCVPALQPETPNEVERVSIGKDKEKQAIKLSISLTKDKLVGVELYTASGLLTTAKIESALLNKGEHALQLNAAYLPAGVYYCKINIAGELITRKVILD